MVNASLSDQKIHEEREGSYMQTIESIHDAITTEKRAREQESTE